MLTNYSFFSIYFVVVLVERLFLSLRIVFSISSRVLTVSSLFLSNRYSCLLIYNFKETREGILKLRSMTARLLFFAFLAFSLLHFAVSQDSPTPPPENGSADNDKSPLPAPEGRSPSISPSISPPAPPPSDLAPGSSPTPANASHIPEVPTPAPSEVSDANHSIDVEAEKDEGSKSEGMSGGKKAGIAIGVLAAVAAVGLGGVVCKKRRQNQRRAQYADAVRRELL